MAHGVVAEKKQNGGEEGSNTSRSPPPPPDGGWGWVVVFASFMIHLVNDGMTYTFGVFYVEFLDYFGEGKGYTAWIVSILVGMTLCSGPITAVLVNWYGCRPVTIAGSILSSICVILSVFAPNVFTLFLTIGFGTGFGFGLIYVPAIVSVTMYFEKYRSLATGIAVCGTGVGTFVFAPLTEKLIDIYGWRGAMLILGGIVLNCTIFGALFRPLETDVADDYVESPTELSVTVGSKQDPLPMITDNGTSSSSSSSIPRSMSSGHMHNQRIVAATSAKPSKTNGHSVGPLALSQPMLNQHVEPARSQRSQSLKRVGSGVMNRPDALYQGSLLNLSAHRRGSLTAEEQSLMMKHGSRSSVRSLAPPPTGMPTTKDFKDTMTSMIDFSLLADPIFIVFTVSNFLTSIGYYIPYVYIVAYAEDVGLPKAEASYLLSVIGIANSIGRIVLGYLSDKPWVNRLFIYNSCLAICGVATFVCIWFQDFYSLALCTSVFGFTIGAYVGLTSVILVDLVGLEKLTNAFGILLLFQGVASFVGSPLAGFLYDELHSYNPGFIVAGVTITLSGIMLFSIPLIRKWQERKEQATATTFDI